MQDLNRYIVSSATSLLIMKLRSWCMWKRKQWVIIENLLKMIWKKSCRKLSYCRMYTARECLFFCISWFISNINYLNLQLLKNPKCSTYFWSVVHVHTKNLPKLTMTQKVYFYAPKWTFNPDSIWDEKWNYMDCMNSCFRLRDKWRVYEMCPYIYDSLQLKTHFFFIIVVNLKRIERVNNERGRDRAFLNINPTK